jgi:uncharacterized protein (UPF0335 family)
METMDNATAERLRSYIERIERLTEEKKAIQADIKDVYGEAKSSGYDPKIMRLIVRMRAMNPSDLEEQKQLTELYALAAGVGK